MKRHSPAPAAESAGRGRGRGNARRPGPFHIVGIGASAGGLNALQEFFDRVPADSGLAYVVVVHLSTEHESRMAEMIQNRCRIPVDQVTGPVKIEPDRVYVIPPDANLDSIDADLRLSALEEKRRDRAAVDHFFESLARTHAAGAVGVLLSGTGSDGALGLRRIQEHGGLTIVQDPAETAFDGMVQNAIKAGAADRVMPAAKMPAAILRWVRENPAPGPAAAETPPPPPTPGERVKALETELSQAKAAIEELENANQELRLTLSNTAENRESLRSAEAELHAFQEESDYRLVEFHRITADLQNLMAAVDIPTLFLDREMNIIRFTPEVKRFFNLQRADRGRPLSDLTHRLIDSRLVGDVRRVLKRLDPAEREVQTDEGKWYLNRILPFRSALNRVEGVVVTFIDITDRKRAALAMEAAENRFRAFVTASADAVFRMSPDWGELRYLKGREFIPDTEAPSRSWLDTYIPPEDQPQILSGVQAAIRNRSIFELEHRVRRVDGSLGWTFLRAVPILDAAGDIEEWIGTARDITERKQAEGNPMESRD